MRRQQALGLLELSWREHKQIFSHMMYGVVGVEEGTLIAERDYSLAWTDQEAFPYWESFTFATASPEVFLTRSMSRNKDWHGQEPFFMSSQH